MGQELREQGEEDGNKDTRDQQATTMGGKDKKAAKAKGDAQNSDNDDGDDADEDGEGKQGELDGGFGETNNEAVCQGEGTVELFDMISEANVIFPGPNTKEGIPSVSAELKAVIQWLMTKDPSKRPSATDVLKHPWVSLT